MRHAHRTPAAQSALATGKQIVNCAGVGNACHAWGAGFGDRNGVMLIVGDPNVSFTIQSWPATKSLRKTLLPAPHTCGAPVRNPDLAPCGSHNPPQPTRGGALPLARTLVDSPLRMMPPAAGAHASAARGGPR